MAWGLALLACGTVPPDAKAPHPAETVPIAAQTPSAVAEPAEPEAVAAVEPTPEAAQTEPAAPIGAEPEPAPIPFEGREHVRVEELIAALDRIADEMAELPAVRADYDALRATHDLADSEALYRDYVRVKLAFEATRDGGLWHLRWAITNEKPNSEQIWKQWRKAPVPASLATEPTDTRGASLREGPDPSIPTAYAECDELSALFAFVARSLGVRHIGLFWPTWNHVVAVWTVQSEDGSPVRIVVPTSQIFLSGDDSLGTDGFDPWTQKTIFEYRRRDVKGSHRLDAGLARFFVQQAQRYAGRSQLELQRDRNARDLAVTAAQRAAENAPS